MKNINKIDKLTIMRTMLLVVALTNQFLAVAGKSPLPIEDSQIELLVSTTWTLTIAIWSWWKNNSFTQNAIEAQEVLNYLKSTNTKENQEDTQV